MFQLLILTLLLAAFQGTADDSYEYAQHNVTRSTLSGIAAYRSALTLDWLDGEDSRQRELVQSYETAKTHSKRGRVADCIGYERPATGKVARLMLELLKNLEGDDGPVIVELIQVLMRSKLLVETAMMDSEPNLDSLVETPGVMMGEPHTTLPRMIALTWLVTTDPVTTKREGWCPVRKLNHYLLTARPIDIAKQMHALDPIVARARFIMEDFIRKVTPLNMFQGETTHAELGATKPPTTKITKRTRTTYQIKEADPPLRKAAPTAPSRPEPFPFPYKLVDANAWQRSLETRRLSQGGNGGGEVTKASERTNPSEAPPRAEPPPNPKEELYGEIHGNGNGATGVSEPQIVLVGLAVAINWSSPLVKWYCR